MAVLPDGKYLIGGSFTDVGGDPGTDFVARLNSNGTRDTTFTPSTLNNQVMSMALLPDGKYLIGGDFDDVGGDNGTDKVARLNSNGTRDITFTPPTLHAVGPNAVSSVAGTARRQVSDRRVLHQCQQHTEHRQGGAARHDGAGSGCGHAGLRFGGRWYTGDYRRDRIRSDRDRHHRRP